MLQTALSLSAIVLSAVTFGLSYRAGQIANRRSRIPVLVFVYDRQRGWLLHNVGNGPALNIMVAARKTHEQPESEWQPPTRVPPIARDDEFELRWLARSNVAVLAATYQGLSRGRYLPKASLLHGDVRLRPQPYRATKDSTQLEY